MTPKTIGDDSGVRSIIAGLMEGGRESARIAPGARLREELGFDSVLMIDLMVEVERRLGVYFDPYLHDLEAIFKTVGTLEEFVAGYDFGP